MTEITHNTQILFPLEITKFYYDKSFLGLIITRPTLQGKYIDWFEIRDSIRSKGIGEEIFTYWLGLQPTGSKVTLHAMNEPAYKFWKKMGFIPQYPAHPFDWFKRYMILE